MAIDVSNLNRLKGSIYEKFKDIPESKLNYIKTNLNPHGFVDNIFYYFDGRKKVLNTIDLIENQREIKKILDKNPELMESTLEHISRIISKKK